MATPNQPENPSGEPPRGWQPHDYGPQQNPQIPPPPGYPIQPGYPPQPGWPQPQPHPGYPSYPGYPGNALDPEAPFGRDPATGVALSDKSGATAGVLQLFLGVFGIGRFYIDSTQIAIAQLCVGLFGFVFSLFAFSAFRSCSVPSSGPSSTRS
jgi:TM2 domain